MKRIIVGPNLIQRPTIVRPSVGFLCRGEVEVSVIDSKTGKTLRKYPKQHNLLLNTFMNRLPTVQFADMFKYCAASTGTTNTADDSGTTVAVSDGSGNVTLSGGSFTLTDTATDAGKIIKWDSGEERRIVTVGSPTTCVVAAEGYNAVLASVSSGQFTVYRTNRTNFSATEVRRSPTGGASQYLTGAGNCGMDYTSPPDVKFTRTYDFAAESGSVTYGEIGFGDVITAGSNLNSIIQLLTPVALVSTNQLRVKYSLTLTLSPTTQQVVNPSVITGWPSNSTGKQQIQLPMTTVVDTNGLTQQFANTLSSPLDPSAISSVSIGVSPSTAVINSFNTNGPDRSSGATTRAAATSAGSYVNFQYYLEKNYQFLVGEANGNIGSIGLCNNGLMGASGQAFIFVLDNLQVKDALHSLNCVFRLSWGRVLA